MQLIESERNSRRWLLRVIAEVKENAKENVIWRQLSDEEYEREKAEIKFRLEVMMELLQKKEEDHKCGFLVTINLKRHKLQRIREQLMNAQYEEEILKARE